jgi:MSHA biogenesis protein MshO
MTSRNQQSGFSLIELIIVIVLLGVLAGAGGLLVLQPIQAYDDQVRRQRLVDQGEMALRQIARDIRHALPNSIRITSVGTNRAVEMVNTIDGARYRDESGTGFNAAVDSLDFATPGDSEFNLLGSFGNFSASATLSGRIVIYNTSASDIYRDADLDNNPGIITPSTSTISMVTKPSTPAGLSPEQHITISSDFEFSQQSPGQRLFVVDGPTSYICDIDSGRIERYSGYGFDEFQPTSPADFSGGSSDTVITQLIGCSMIFQAGTSQRGGILTVQLTIGDGSGEDINLLHQIHVVNVP